MEHLRRRQAIIPPLNLESRQAAAGHVTLQGIDTGCSFQSQDWDLKGNSSTHCNVAAAGTGCHFHMFTGQLRFCTWLQTFDRNLNSKP